MLPNALNSFPATPFCLWLFLLVATSDPVAVSWKPTFASTTSLPSLSAKTKELRTSSMSSVALNSASYTRFRLRKPAAGSVTGALNCSHGARMIVPCSVNVKHVITCCNSCSRQRVFSASVAAALSDALNMSCS